MLLDLRFAGALQGNGAVVPGLLRHLPAEAADDLLPGGDAGLELLAGRDEEEDVALAVRDDHVDGHERTEDVVTDLEDQIALLIHDVVPAVPILAAAFR